MARTGDCPDFRAAKMGLSPYAPRFAQPGVYNTIGTDRRITPMEFDPYQQWLNIPPSRRPASYYDLLGLSADVTDNSQIEEAAARRYAHVRNYALGPQSDQAQRILAELSQAVICLTDPQRRREYDRQRRPRKIEDWPVADREPVDFYEMLGERRFGPDRDRLLSAIRAAGESLRCGQYDPDTRCQAERLQQELDAAEAALATPMAYWDYHRKIIARLRTQYTRLQVDPGKHWHPDHLQEWLETDQSVHPARARAISQALLADEGEARGLVLGDFFVRKQASMKSSSEHGELDAIIQDAISALAGRNVGKRRPG